MRRPEHTALELVRRINRARAKGEDAAILERQLQSHLERPKPRKAKPTRSDRVIAQQPKGAKLLRSLLSKAKRRGFQLGWVMFHFKDKFGAFPGRALWKAVVGKDDRDEVIDRYVERVAMQARSTGF